MQISEKVVRDPDGVPHEVVGLTWLLTLAVAIASFAALRFASVTTAFALVLVPAIVIALDRRARNQRE
jgi:hypothetical protein